MQDTACIPTYYPVVPRVMGTRKTTVELTDGLTYLEAYMRFLMDDLAWMCHH